MTSRRYTGWQALFALKKNPKLYTSMELRIQKCVAGRIMEGCYSTNISLINSYRIIKVGKDR